MKKLYQFATIIMAALVIGGCAAKGASFVKPSAAPANEALVVFYRPKAYAGGAASVPILDNDEEVAKIQNGQFLMYEASPGAHKLHSKTAAIDRVLELDVEAGKTYYVEVAVRVGVWVGSWEFRRVYEEEALTKLATCCKSGTEG